jgi:hypothetical protein
MNLFITLPKTNLSLDEWFVKHKVSTKLYPLTIGIAKAQDSLLNV